MQPRGWELSTGLASPWHALPHTSLRLISSLPPTLSPGVISSLRPLTATLFKISGPYTTFSCLPLLPDFLPLPHRRYRPGDVCCFRKSPLPLDCKGLEGEEFCQFLLDLACAKSSGKIVLSEWIKVCFLGPDVMLQKRFTFKVTFNVTIILEGVYHSSSLNRKGN